MTQSGHSNRADECSFGDKSELSVIKNKRDR